MHFLRSLSFCTKTLVRPVLARLDVIKATIRCLKAVFNLSACTTKASRFL